MRLIVFVFLGGRLVMEMVVRGAQSLAVRCLQKRGLKYDLEGKYVSGRNMDALGGRGGHSRMEPSWLGFTGVQRGRPSGN